MTAALPPFVGVVAAAGASSRMGRPKALLPHPAGGTFVEHLARQFLDAGCQRLFVSLPDDVEDALTITMKVLSLPVDADVNVACGPNQHMQQGLMGTVWTVLDAADLEVPLVLAPVDLPVAPVAIVQALVTTCTAGAAVVEVDVEGVPTRGHPVAFAPSTADLLRTQTDGGPRAALQTLEAAGRVAVVRGEDARSTWNMNTPADHQQVLDSFS